MAVHPCMEWTPIKKNTIDTCAAFSVDAVTRTDIGYLRTRCKRLVIAMIKNLFPMPAPPLKNIWNGLGSNLLTFLG